MKVHATHFVLPHAKGAPCADACAVRVVDETVFAVLADGAGASDGAREAAHRVVETLMAQLPARPTGWAADRALAELAGLINRSLHDEGVARAGEPCLVSTLVAVVVEGDRLHGFSVGDSRAYLARDGALRQLSQDHADPKQSNLLLRAIGLAPQVEGCAFSAQLEDGDGLVLCSDGVWGAPQSLRFTVGDSAQAVVEDAAARMRTAARDDMSAVVIHLPETGSMRAEKAKGWPVPGELKAGQEVDGWRLLRPLDPAARTWVAEQVVVLPEGVEPGGPPVKEVLKFAPLEAQTSDVHLELFIRESWHATGVHGDAFVRAQMPEAPSMRYYRMEFVDAPSLEAVLKTRRLAPDEAAGLARFLAEACAHLLRRDLIHGDIKPENILVTGDPAKPAFKLVDLGSAAPVFSVVSRAGTASFLAPERFHGAPVAERTEIFAIGVTVYRALTGKYPFGEIERFQTPQFAPPKRPSDLNPNTPPWMDALLLRCLSLIPEGRHQHFADLAFDLAHPAQVQPFGAVPKTAGDVQARALKFYKTGFWVLAVVGAGLAVLLGAALVLWARVTAGC